MTDSTLTASDRRLERAARLVATLLLVWPAAPAVAGHGLPAYVTSRQDLERAIGAELPAGSARARVEAFLDARRMPHAYDPAGRSITLAVVDLGAGWLAKRELSLTFVFDVSDRLIAWRVE